MAACAVLSWAPSAFATNYWNFGFDCLTVNSAGCLTSNGVIDQVSNATLDTTEKHSGTGSMKLTVDNTQGDTGMKPLNAFTLDRTIPVFYRWWMKMDSAYRWGTGNRLMKLNRVKQFDDNLGFSMTNHWQYNEIGLSECDTCTPQGAGGDNVMNVFYDFNPATNSAVTTWQEYIIEFHFSTGGGTAPGVLDASNAVMKLYVNGVLVDTAPEAVSLCCRSASLAGSTENGAKEAWGGMGVNTFPQLNCNVGDTVCGGTIWIDDVSTDTTWNSTQFTQGGGGGGSPAAGDSVVMFVSSAALSIIPSALLFAWTRRETIGRAALALWRYAASMPSPKEMYWVYRYKKAVKRWQKSSPVMIEHQPSYTIELTRSSYRVERR